MSELVAYQLDDDVATITMDDGKVNALSPRMLAELNEAFDRVEKDGALAVMTGRPGVFSAGFDLKVLTGGGPEARALLRSGFELAARMLSFPTPVVIACSGHALAMAVFLVLSGDYRIGAAGEHKIGANEVAIGMTMPFTAIEICRQRLQPSYFHRVVINAEIFSPEDAIAAGLLDRVVPAAELAGAARDTAAQLATLNLAAHAATKLRTRDQALTAIRAAIEADDQQFAAFMA
jgi:enoyl-CoA hydratase